MKLADLLHANVVLNPVVMGCALIAAVGMFFIVSALGMLGGIHIRVGSRISLQSEDDRMSGITAYTGSFAERVLAPLVREAMMRTSAHEREWVEQAYDLLDLKGKGSADYYLQKIIGGIAGFAMGLALGLMAASRGGLWPVFVLPLGLSVLGYYLPKLGLKTDLSNRSEQIFFEVPYVLDRLGVSLVANNGDLVTALSTLLRRPEGGFLMRELLQVVEDNAKAGHLEQTLERMAQRNKEVTMVVRLAELLINSQKGAANLIQSLQDIGDRAVIEVENRITKRGEENSQAMVGPSMIALTGVLISLLGPSFINLIKFAR